MRDYTVIVYPAPPATRGIQTGAQMGAVTVAQPPRVKTVRRCATPQEAANRAEVQPGERCEVVVDARHYRRAVQAPLEELGDDLAPLPTVAPMPASA